MNANVLTCLLTILCSLFLWVSPAFGETDEEEEKALELYAQSAVLMDADSGRILYGKEELLERPMASTTKIMTCILALECGNPTDVVTASSFAAGQPKVHLGVRVNETFYLKDILYSLMLESHNDAAVMIAEHIGGSVEGFADMMNQKARDIGCGNTYFITPNGLDAEETDENGVRRIHSTTAADLAGIMRYCVWESPKREEFLTITQTQNYYFTDLDGKRSFNCTNHNAFLTMMTGVLSGKTGFTGGAGYSYIGALEDDGRKFVVALLGCGWPPHKTYKWSDTRALFRYGLAHYQYRDVFEEEKKNSIPVRNGVTEDGDIGETVYTELSLRLREEEKSLNLLLKDDEKVRCVYDVPSSLEAPVNAGAVAGTVTYYLEEKPVKVYPLYTTTSVERISLRWCVQKIANTFLSMDGVVYLTPYK